MKLSSKPKKAPRLVQQVHMASLHFGWRKCVMWLKLHLQLFLENPFLRIIFQVSLRLFMSFRSTKEKETCPSNYRSVSLTNCVANIFECVVTDELTSHLEEKIILTPNQHGFCNSCSCLSQLLSHYDSIINKVKESGNVKVLYLNFSKAFNKVTRWTKGWSTISCSRARLAGILLSW